MVEGDAERQETYGAEEMRVYIHTFGVEVGQAVERSEEGIRGRPIMAMNVVIVLLPWLEFIPVEEASFCLGGVG